MKHSLILAFISSTLFISCSIRKLTPSTIKDEHANGISFAPCGPKTPVNTICSISPLAIHPTQFALGYRDVEKKRAKLRKIKDEPEKIDEYLKKKIIPAVIGPDFVYYIMDGHHTSRALAEESILVIYAQVLDDFSNMPMDDFLNRLKTENWLWLYDENGVGNQDPRSIPTRITDLKDDPYRALAEDAQEEGAFEEKPVYFQQFMWGNYFRPLIDRELIGSDYKKAIEEAIKWAKHPNAAKLPGYKFEKN